MNPLKTLKEYQSSPEWSVHVEERLVFPQVLQLNDWVEMCYEPICKLLFIVWLIPIKALEKTETPGGPVWSGKVALDEYRCYKFEGAAIFIDNSRFNLLNYLHTVRGALNKVDLSAIKPDQLTYHKLDYEPTPETEPPASV